MQDENWCSYILTFIKAYRREVAILQEQDEFLFKWHVKEQALEEPCQIEILEFNDPYGIAWLFLFDNTQSDCLCSICRTTWKKFPKAIKIISRKHPTLKIQTKLLQMVNGFWNYRDSDLLYSLDGSKNALAIFFPYDVRKRDLGRITRDPDPNAIAEAIFHLNRGQESTYW